MMINPFLANKNSLHFRQKRSKGRLITLIDLAIIMVIFIIMFSRLQNRAEPVTQHMGYNIILNSINFNGQTLVELRTKRGSDFILKSFIITFYDADFPLSSYSLTFPTSQDEQVNEFVLPQLLSPVLKATLQHEETIIALTSKVKVMLP